MLEHLFWYIVLSYTVFLITVVALPNKMLTEFLNVLQETQTIALFLVIG